MADMRDILSRWPSRQALADDTGAGLAAVHNWHRRNRLPAQYDGAIIAAAAKRGIPLDIMEIVQVRASGNAPEGSCLSPQDSGSAAETKSFPVRNNYDGGGA